MTPPTPAAELTWDGKLPPIGIVAVPDRCPACDAAQIENYETGTCVRYSCGKAYLRAWDYTFIPASFGRCRNAETAAVAQRRRADAAEAALAEQRERGDKYALGWIDETKRADALEAERAAAYVRADTEYAARVRLVQDYDKLDADRDALTAQVAALRTVLEHARVHLERYVISTPFPGYEIYSHIVGEIDAALTAAPEGETP